MTTCAEEVVLAVVIDDASVLAVDDQKAVIGGIGSMRGGRSVHGVLVFRLSQEMDVCLGRRGRRYNEDGGDDGGHESPDGDAHLQFDFLPGGDCPVAVGG